MSETLTPQKYPYDFDSLNKGDYLSQDDCERILGMRESDDPAKYAFALMKLKDQIRDYRLETGAPIVPRQRKNGIRILTDEEADVWLENEQKAHLHKHGRDLSFQLRCIEVKNLSEERKKKRDRAIIRNARIRGQIDKARRQKIEEDKTEEIAEIKRREAERLRMIEGRRRKA